MEIIVILGLIGGILGTFYIEFKRKEKNVKVEYKSIFPNTNDEWTEKAFQLKVIRLTPALKHKKPIRRKRYYSRFNDEFDDDYDLYEKTDEYYEEKMREEQELEDWLNEKNEFDEWVNERNRLDDENFYNDDDLFNRHGHDPHDPYTNPGVDIVVDETYHGIDHGSDHHDSGDRNHF